MTSETVTIRFDKRFLHDLDIVSKRSGYYSRTEFIRDAVRKKIEAENLKLI